MSHQKRRRKDRQFAYECASCNTIHQLFSKVRTCCLGGYFNVFLCRDCGRKWYTNREAEACCREGE